jgi:hypothetical protein
VSVCSLSFRSYLAPALLAVVALTFLIVGGPSKDALVGAGFALAGAVASPVFEGEGERNRGVAPVRRSAWIGPGTRVPRRRTWSGQGRGRRPR